MNECARVCVCVCVCVCACVRACVRACVCVRAFRMLMGNINSVKCQVCSKLYLLCKNLQHTCVKSSVKNILMVYVQLC